MVGGGGDERAQNIRNKFNCSKIDLKSILNAAMAHNNTRTHLLFCVAELVIVLHRVLQEAETEGIIRFCGHFFTSIASIPSAPSLPSILPSLTPASYLPLFVIVSNWISSVRF